ncbi:hypothetical protein XELAEV_180274492mg, partial [Xenopus laevis]
MHRVYHKGGVRVVASSGLNVYGYTAYGRQCNSQTA